VRTDYEQIAKELPMTDLAVVRSIRELDENGAVALARALIFAEAGAHRLPLDEFTMSGRVKVADQGIDGRTHFPDAPGVLLPSGSQVWQVKSGRSAPSVNREFDADKHQGLLKAIQDGYDYVLFWTYDPVDPDLASVKRSFNEAVQQIRSDARATFLFGDAIERLCLAHLGVLVQLSPIPLSSVVSLAVWAPQEFEQIQFQPDEGRTRFIATLRTHASSWDPSSPAGIHVLGDTGVGKSRLVHQALAVPGVGERVLVAPDAAALDTRLLSQVAQYPERKLVIVVDDCDLEDRTRLVRYADMARGRIRLITIGSRSSRKRQADSRYLEVLPLEVAASKQIALSVGLGEQEADLVAEYTEGYPGLALTLARAIQHGEAGGSLIERVRSHEEIGRVLSSLLPSDDVLPLGMLALFEKLGFEGDLAQELSLACETLGVDEAQVHEVAQRELKRFVSTAGRFRRVTPRLFALWLAIQFLNDRRASLTTALTGLPESLRDRIVAQMRDFAGDHVVADALGEILELPPFREGALGAVDEGAGRLLHVAAIAAPQAAMAAIERVLAGASTEDLRDFGPGRREMVWALEVLLWFEDLFDRAGEALLRLAAAENETWANNATGVLNGIFGVFLGGTGAPYPQRLQWAKQALEKFGEVAEPFIVDGLGHALEAMESRRAPDFGGRIAPEEWRPRAFTEEVDARGGAWDLLIRIGRTSPREADHVATVLAAGLRTALLRGLHERVLTDLRGIPWSASARGVLGDALSKTLKHDQFPDELAGRLRELQTELQGASLTEQLDYVLSLSPWQLSTDDELTSGRPRILQELAAELAQAERAELSAVASRTRDGDQQTAGLLFEELAKALDDVALLAELEALDPVPQAALLGCLSGLTQGRDEAWVDEILERWLQTPSLAGLVIAAVHRLPATDRRAQLATDAVDRGASTATELGRLLYGAWTRPLTEAAVIAIAGRLAAAGGAYAVEHGLGILDQWTEHHAESSFSTELTSVTLDLIRQGSHVSDRSAMIALHRSRLLQVLGLGLEERLTAVVDIFRSLKTFAGRDDLELLDKLTTEDHQRTIDTIVDLLVGDDEGSFQPWLMWLDQAKLLSRLERASSSQLVVDTVIQRVEPAKWPRLIDHLDLSPTTPDPLLVELLDRSNEPSLHGRALFRFMHPEMAYWGSESAYLRGRRRIAEQWIEAAPPQSGYRTWLDELIQTIDRRIESVEVEEAEQDY
jgi:hypothetical protein